MMIDYAVQNQELLIARLENVMKPEMTAAAVVEILQLLESAGIELWLDGGWAVDTLLGEQTRPHKDLDIILPFQHLPKLQETLSRRGFANQPGGTPSNFVLENQSGLEVDVHAIIFDQDGNGVYQMADGGKWIFPAAGFDGRGIINGVVVRCLSAEVQVLCHANGYVPTEKDFRDMELLQVKFGVELPPHLRRNAI
jgi:lincosamide nucleotidyltransferase A/C/D/E